MTVRKNFHFDEEVAQHLAEIAKLEGKTQTQIAQEAIEEKYKEIRIKKKLDALKHLAGCAPEGSLKDVDVRESRVEKAVKNG
jgi:predicted transcriptional regulator